MERELPTIKIEGTEFLLDVGQVLLIEKDNPENTISFFEMRDKGNGYSFDYNRKSHNIPAPWDRAEDNVRIELLQLIEMDPYGMAKKYGLPLKDIHGKSDLDVMVDSRALEQRLKGRLTTVDIVGHIFYVDIPMDKLRPKDDFLSKGIPFKDIDHYFDDEEQKYIIPYNPEKHEFQEIDTENLVEFPKDLLLIAFPGEWHLDPIGYNRKHGQDLMSGLKETSISPHFVAKIMDWKEIGIQDIIDENRERLGIKKTGEPPQKHNRQKRGRGI